jgi:uncharacterized repeat protein (TIGR03803 family)
LVLSSNTLYGTTSGGGSAGYGTVFALNTDGTGVTNLHNFTGVSDGAYPTSGLTLWNSTLYGTASSGGSSNYGTVFALNTDGTGFTNLHSFTGADGMHPQAGLVLSGNILYGMANTGGSTGRGAVFALSTDGTAFTILHNFTATFGRPSTAFTNIDGARPLAGLILSSNTLYGTASTGGFFGKGTVFSISLQIPLPQMAITLSGTNSTLQWPTNAIGFTLHSTTNLVPPEVWTPVSQAPVIVNGQYTVTNLMSDSQRFFRLSQP